MRRRAALEGNARSEKQPKALGPLVLRALNARHLRPVSAVGGHRLDVEPHPGEVGEHLGEPRGVAAARVQADLVPHLLHGPHGGGERRIEAGLAAREDDAVEKSVAPLQKRLQLLPGRMLEPGIEAPLLHPAVLAVDAPPGTALHERHRRESARKVDGRKGREARELQFRSRGPVSVMTVHAAALFGLPALAVVFGRALFREADAFGELALLAGVE